MNKARPYFYDQNTAALVAPNCASAIYPGATFTTRGLEQAERNLARSASNESPGESLSRFIKLKQIARPKLYANGSGTAPTAATAFTDEFKQVFKPSHAPSRLQRGSENLETISIEGKSLTLVKPSLFYARDCNLGLGLFCQVDLEPGDIWWLNNLEDKRFTRQLIKLQNLDQMDPNERAHVQKYGYIDVPSRLIVMCTSPFGLVNHANKKNANSDSDEYGNHIATKAIRAGEEIRVGYEYDAMLSIIWKFPAIASLFSQQQLVNEDFLLSPASAHRTAVDFLDTL